MNANFQHQLSAETSDVLLEASQLLGKSLNPEVTIGAILQLLSMRLQLYKGRVMLPDPESGELKIRYFVDLNKTERQQAVYAPGEGVTGRVMATGQVALIPDVTKEPLYLARITDLSHMPDKKLAYIAVPILQDDLPIGVLAVQTRRSCDYVFDRDLYVLQILAAMIGQLSRIHELVNDHTKQLLKANSACKGKGKEKGTVYGILGESKALRNAVGKALRAAESDATVLLVGESGSGKERFARMIHLASQRRDQPFVCVNCAAIPAQLLESELFGHEKGSFTGADASRVGKFELAANGTLFLDEIGDMSLDLQAKVLRIMQDKMIQRVGGNKETQVDTRIITATNKNLQRAVNEGAFRVDLYYRINVIRIGLPPLRARRDDIRLLASYFLIRENQRHHRNVVIEAKGLSTLEEYDWPGNVRQLENVIARTVIMSDTSAVTEQDIQDILCEEATIDVEPPHSANESQNTIAGRPYTRVNGNERQSIEDALRIAGGNKTLAANHLGLTPRQLYYRMNKLEIPL
ncbi:MAG: sigma 54-interacting transcriptional regulator [Gammaproteobacteria bacterium]|nr:sigma 54-interacting transcriptional regulator [Gammaproteobacteria bacterium]